MKAELFLRNYKIISHLNNDLTLISKGHKIFSYNQKTSKMSFLNKLPVPFYLKIISYSKLLSRLFRYGVILGIQKDNESSMLVFNKKIYTLNLNNNEIYESFDLKRGSRPLNITNIKNIKGFDDQVCFGEYFTNFEKKEVHIYTLDKDNNWKISFTFPEGEIEHIHNIVPDKNRNLLWILTGDFDNSSGIWVAENNFNKVYPILRGEQDFRACVAFPTNEGLLYGTDTQFKQNSIRLLYKEKEWKTRKILDVNGPIIYGAKFKDDFYFSTSVEGESSEKGKYLQYFDRTKGKGIITNYSHIIKGNLNDGFKVVYKNKKDIYPFILFQFGSITFPTGESISDYIYINVNALKEYDQSIVKLKN